MNSYYNIPPPPPPPPQLQQQQQPLQQHQDMRQYIHPPPPLQYDYQQPQYYGQPDYMQQQQQQPPQIQQGGYYAPGYPQPPPPPQQPPIYPEPDDPYTYQQQEYQPNQYRNDERQPDFPSTNENKRSSQPLPSSSLPRKRGQRNKADIKPVENTRRYENKELAVEKGPDKAVVQRLAIEGNYKFNKITETNAEKYDFCVADIQATFKRLYISQDFVKLTRCKLSSDDEEAIYTSLTRSIPVSITKKSNKSDSGKKGGAEPPEAPASLHNGKTKYLSSVMLLNGKNTKSNDKEKGKGKVTFYDLEKEVKFLIAGKDRTIFAPGGFWNSELDGPEPQDDGETLVRTAIRCFKSQTQIDLGACRRWIKFSEARYFLKEDEGEGFELVSVIYIPVYTPSEEAGEITIPSKNGPLAFSWLSLNGLLDYNEEDIGTFEISLFGEMFKILLCSIFGRKILDAIRDHKKEEEGDDGEALSEPDEKRCKTEGADGSVLHAFQFFDKGATGFLKSKDLSAILLFLNSGLSRRMVQDYVSQFESKESSGFVPYAQIVIKK